MTDFLDTDWVIEPCNVNIIHCITSINLANIGRNKCNGTSKELLINKRGITGDVIITPGFNCVISARNNLFTIESLKGGGACGSEDYCGASKVPMNAEEEELIKNGNFIDDCIMCNETIKAINGITGKAIKIQGGPGVIAEVAKNDPHTLVLTLNTQQFKNECNNDKTNTD